MLDANTMQQGIQPVTRAIVTGASGFIGRALALHLLKRNVEVIAIDCRPTTLPCVSHVIDLRTNGALDFFLDERSVVFHMAARADVGESVRDPRGDFEGNIAVTFEILESVRSAGCRLLYPSTASVFDSMNALPLSRQLMLSQLRLMRRQGSRRGLLCGLSSFVQHRCPHRPHVQRVWCRDEPVFYSRSDS